MKEVRTDRGQTDGRTERDRWEGEEADGERSNRGRVTGVGSSREKELAEEQERGVRPQEREGAEENKEERRDKVGGGQAIRKKATGNEEKWGMEEGSGERKGQMAVGSMRSASEGSRAQESRQPDRVAQEKEVEE